jgi:hypothetical protein
VHDFEAVRNPVDALEQDPLGIFSDAAWYSVKPIPNQNADLARRLAVNFEDDEQNAEYELRSIRSSMREVYT